VAISDKVLVKNFWKSGTFSSNFVGPYEIKQIGGFGKILVSINGSVREVDRDDIKRWSNPVSKVIPIPSLDVKSIVKKPVSSKEAPKSSNSAVKYTPSSIISPKKAVPDPVSSPSSPIKNNKEDTLVGRRIEVWWNKEKKWYPGVVDRVSDNPRKGTHEVLYDDEKDHEDPNIYEFLEGDKKARFRFVDGE